MRREGLQVCLSEAVKLSRACKSGRGRDGAGVSGTV